MEFLQKSELGTASGPVIRRCSWYWPPMALELLDGDHAAGDVSADVLCRQDIVDDDRLRLCLDIEIQFAL